MYTTNLRPYGEYFANNQPVTESPVEGNDAGGPVYLAPAQAAVAITVATPLTGSLTLPAGASLTLQVLGARKRGGPAVLLGTACHVNEGQTPRVFGPDCALCDFIPGRELATHPWVSVRVLASEALEGSVDIFPQIISQPRRAA